MSSDFAKKEKINRATPFGLRFLKAFADGANITSKAEMADKLGYRSDKVIYKIINGEQEMGFENLLRFREVTGHSIDWLLFGDNAVPGHDDWISIRKLISPMWLTDIEEIRQSEMKNRGEPIAFEDLLNELFHRGVKANAISNHDLAEMLHKLANALNQDTRDDHVGGIKNAEMILAPSIGRVGDDDAEEVVRKAK